MKDKLYAEVWTKGGHCSEMGTLEPVCWGQVIRQTPKSIWIQGRKGYVEKWNLQPNGRWRYPHLYGRIEKDFDFRLDPLIKFVMTNPKRLRKKAAE